MKLQSSTTEKEQLERWMSLCVFLLQLVRTCARYHQEQKKSEERLQKEREIHLRHIASTLAREVEFFWSNIEQVCMYVYLIICSYL